MKIVPIIAMALFAVSGAAIAADLPAKAPAAAVRSSCANFGGFYVGAHGASTTHDWRWDDRDSWARNEFDANLPDSVSSRKTGIGGGVQGGYNWQRRCTVFGFEADWTWAGLRNNRFLTDGDAGAAQDTLAVNTKLDWYGTLRTRTGVVVDDLLIYVTGGFAYASINRSFTAVDTGVSTETFAERRNRWGWTAGVGTEWQWTTNWSVKGEVLYVSLSDRETTFNSAVATANGNNPSKRFNNEDSLWSARLGLNYRFGM